MPSTRVGYEDLPNNPFNPIAAKTRLRVNDTLDVMRSKSSRLVLSLLVCYPVLALAHGEEVLLFPVGTLLALVVLFVICHLLSSRWPVRLLTISLAFVVSLPFWYLPGDALPNVARYSGWGNFAVGFVPSLLVGALVIWLFHRLLRTRDGI